MVRLPRVIVFLSLVWVSAAAGFADVVVKYRVHADSITPPSRGDETCSAQAKRPKTGDIVTLTWSSDRARVDRPGTSMILRTDEKRLYLLFHDVRKYVEFDYPVPYKKYRGRMNEMLDDMLKFRVESLAGPEPATVMERSATRYAAALVNDLRQRWRVTFASTAELPLDPKIALALWEASHELGFGGEGWWRLLPIEGRLPLVWEQAVRQPDTEDVYREEATEIGERATSPDAYAIPEGYAKVKYDPQCMHVD